MTWRETMAVQQPGMADSRTVVAAQQAMLSNMLEAQRTIVWVMDEHFAALLRTTSQQLQAAYRDLAAAQARAAIAEARAAASDARAAQAEAIIAMLKQELDCS